MKKTRLVALTLALVLTFVGGLTACGKSGDAKSGDYQYISAKEVLEKKDGHILDVREDEKYKAGTVEGAEHQAIFPLDDDSLATAMANYAKSNLSDGKNIYIICNSGKKGAEKTTGILIDNGIDKSKIFTVEGGAKALSEIDGALKPVE